MSKIKRKIKIKKGDEIVVIAGRDKGKRGKVTALVKKGEFVIVEGVNTVKKTVKANPNANEPGGIKEKQLPIHCSNVSHYDSVNNKPSRVGFRMVDGRKVRFLKSNDQVIDL